MVRATLVGWIVCAAACYAPSGGPADRTAPADVPGATDAPFPDVPGTIAFRGASTNPGGTLATLTLARPGDVAIADVLVASLMYRSSGSITPPAGWTVALDTALGNSHMTSFVKTASANEPASYDFTVPLASGLCGGITAWTGVTTLDASASATGNDTSVEAPSVTTTGPDRLLVAVLGHVGRVTYTPPPDMIERFEVAMPEGTTYLGSNAHASSLQVVAGATGVRTATASTSGGGWIAQTLALY